MQFADEKILLWLWAAVVLVLFFWYQRRRHRQILGRFAAGGLIEQLVPSLHQRRIFIKQILLVGVFVFGILALARPQWGFEWRKVKKEGVDILIAIDTSKSMLTADVKPNRLQRAKLAVQDLVKKLKGDRLGIIAFAGDAFLMCPLTVDYSGILLTLESLDAGAVPRGGTRIAEAIDLAVKEYRDIKAKHKSLVILTDGENLTGDPVAAARRARQAGVRVYCVGLGTREGELIQVTNVFNEKEFLKDSQGNFVKSRLNEKVLSDIALAAGGSYVRAAGAQLGLERIYEQELSRLEKRTFKTKMEKRYFERFYIPLALALVLLITATGLSTYKKRVS